MINRLLFDGFRCRGRLRNELFLTDDAHKHLARMRGYTTHYQAYVDRLDGLSKRMSGATLQHVYRDATWKASLVHAGRSHR